jgi:hypothetical protein
VIEVAVAVPTLVVVTDAGTNDVDVRQIAHDEVAQGNVLFHDLALVDGQGGRLAEH